MITPKVTAIDIDDLKKMLEEPVQALSSVRVYQDREHLNDRLVRINAALRKFQKTGESSTLFAAANWSRSILDDNLAPYMEISKIELILVMCKADRLQGNDAFEKFKEYTSLYFRQL